MCSYLISKCMCLITYSLNHLRFHLKLTRNPLSLCVEYTACNHKLNKVNILALCDINLNKCFIYIVSSYRNRTSHMSTRHRNSFISCKYSWSVSLAISDIIPYSCIKISQTSDSSYSSNTTHKLCLCKILYNLICHSP